MERRSLLVAGAATVLTAVPAAPAAGSAGFRARLRDLPPAWTVGDKSGSSTSYGAANDIAVVWPPGGAPVVMAIYTNRDAPDAAFDNAVIADTATILARALGLL